MIGPTDGGVRFNNRFSSVTQRRDGSTDTMATEDADAPSGTERASLQAAATKLLAGRDARESRLNTPSTPLDTISETRYHDERGVEGGSADETIGGARPSGTVGDPGTMARNIDLGKQLRRAIKRSGLTRNQIAKRTDLSYAIVHGFVAGTTDIRLATASKIAAVVGVELRYRKTGA